MQPIPALLLPDAMLCSPRPLAGEGPGVREFVKAPLSCDHPHPQPFSRQREKGAERARTLVDKPQPEQEEG